MALKSEAKRPVRVLLIEDDEDDYLLTRDLFTEVSRDGYELEWIADADAGLAALTRGEHDICLLDYRLGRRTGLDLLRAAGKARSIPVILLTGQTERALDHQAMQAGATDFLEKSRLDGVLLERSLRYALQNKHHEDELLASHAALETRVAERTAELAAANAALREEVDERKRVEAMLREADQRKDEFVATLAHELRNPLAPLRNALEIIKRSDGTVGVNAQKMMERQLDQMVRLIDDLLDVSRISRGFIALEKTSIEFAKLVEAAVETSRPLIDQAHQQLTVTLPAEPVYLNADPTRLAQVLANLLNNASKYTGRGGRIRLSATVEKNSGANGASGTNPGAQSAGDKNTTPRGAGEKNTPGDELAVRVADNGIGIDAAMLPRVFDMFTQVDTTPQRRGGLGIGLTLVRKLVEMHQGSVEAHSEGPARGSEFIIRLPFAAASGEGRQASTAPATPPARQRAPLRILVVDDNHDSAESLGALLESTGNEVRLAHDGPEALALALAQPPDVMLLDIGLPGMSGHEVARRMGDEPALGNVVLIALTGWGTASDRDRSKEAGFDHHLVKPVEFEALQALITSIGAEIGG